MVQKFQSDLAGRVQEVFFETATALVSGAASSAREQVGSQSRPPRSKSGRYMRSIYSEMERNQGQVIGRIFSDHPQAPVLEFGSRPHVIEARNKKNLFWPGARFPVRKVNHPGTPAFRVLGGGAERILDNSPAIFNQMLERKFSLGISDD